MLGIAGMRCASGPSRAAGTSFTAGKGIWTSDAFPARLEAMLKSAGEDVQVENQGRNGDSTPDLLNRPGDAVPKDVASWNMRAATILAPAYPCRELSIMSTQ